jgi:WD40 repeat protein
MVLDDSAIFRPQRPRVTVRRSAAPLILLLAFGPSSHAAPFVPPRDAHCVAFSPDGGMVAVGISGQSNGEFPPGPHPNPRKSAVVQWFDWGTKARLRRIYTFGDLTQLTFSPDASLLAAARLFVSDDGIELNEVRVWETSTGRTRFVFDRCHAFSFAPQGDELLVVSRRRCVGYSTATGDKVRELPPLANAIRVAHGAQGEHVCGIVQADAGYRLRACDSLGKGRSRDSSPLAEPFYSLAVPSGATRLATGHAQGLVLLWDPVTLQQIARVTTGGTGRAFPFFSSSGELLGAADQENSDVVIWDLASRRELSRYTFRQGSLHTYLSKSPQRTVRPEEDPVRFAFSPDGTSFLGGPFGGIVRMVDDGRDIARFGD